MPKTFGWLSAIYKLLSRETTLIKDSLKLRCFMLQGLAGCIFILLSVIPVRLMIAAYQAPYPQAILVLGGEPNREVTAVQIAHTYSKIEVWVSSGPSVKNTKFLFYRSGIAAHRLHIDLRATDTVTNFTTLVQDFKQRQIQHIFLITSDFHMPRAATIATLVLGSQGITFTPISVPSNRSAESWLKIIRDGGRSIVWIFTGRTGASFKEFTEEKASSRSNSRSRNTRSHFCFIPDF